MLTAASIEIEGPIDDVFRLTNDHVAEWSDVVVEDIPLDDHEGVGSRFRSITDGENGRMEFEGEVTAWDPPTHSAVFLDGASFNIEVDYHFESLGPDRTRVSQSSTVAGKGLFRLMFFCMGWAMKRRNCDALEKELNNLKRFCESQLAKR